MKIQVKLPTKTYRTPTTMKRMEGLKNDRVTVTRTKGKTSLHSIQILLQQTIPNLLTVPNSTSMSIKELYRNRVAILKDAKLFKDKVKMAKKVRSINCKKS